MNFDEPLDRSTPRVTSGASTPTTSFRCSSPTWTSALRSPSRSRCASTSNPGVFGYPRGLHATDRAQLDDLAGLVVDRMQQRYGWSIAIEDVVPTPGAVSGLNIACHALAASDDAARRTVLVQTPVYPQILTAPAKAGVAREESPLIRDADGRYSVDWDSFTEATGRSGMFILCNPHNPVGRVFDRAELERLAEICLASNTIICSDEIHSDLLFDGHEHIPIATLDPAIARQSITITGPSKTFNLAGLQCSFAIIPDPALRKRYRRFRNAAVPWVNAMGVIGASAAYRDGQLWLDELLPYLASNRDLVVDFVRRELPGVTVRRLRRRISPGSTVAIADWRTHMSSFCSTRASRFPTAASSVPAAPGSSVSTLRVREPSFRKRSIK